MLYEYSFNTAKNFIVPTFDDAGQFYLDHQRLLTLTKVHKLRSKLQTEINYKKIKCFMNIHSTLLKILLYLLLMMLNNFT